MNSLNSHFCPLLKDHKLAIAQWASKMVPESELARNQAEATMNNKVEWAYLWLTFEKRYYLIAVVKQIVAFMKRLVGRKVRCKKYVCIYKQCDRNM